MKRSIHEKGWLQSKVTDPYLLAKEEHAFLLRCEGLKIREVQELVRGHAPMLLARFAHRLNRAMRHTHFRIEKPE